MSITQINSRHVAVTPSIMEHVNQRARHLQAMHPSLVCCRVTFDSIHASKGQVARGYTVRLAVSLFRKSVCVAHGTADDLHRAIHLVFVRAHRVMVKHSSRLFWRRRAIKPIIPAASKQASEGDPWDAASSLDVITQCVINGPGDGFEVLWRCSEQ